jgi:poly(hydroxyalkanoate) depolymerase family esterase
MFGRLWDRTKAFVGRLFGREPAPGRFESGSKWSLRGFLAVAPFVLPSREYLVYVPKGRSPWRRAPLVVLCHGCKETPEEFAQGTRIAELADRQGFVVLLPRQKDSANPWRCWNWFDIRSMQGKGEAAIIAAQIRSVRRRYRCDRKRVLVAGMSAGGAMAAVMGVRHPGLVTAVAVHSGVACGAAKSPLTALTVMQSGPEQDVVEIAEGARASARRSAFPVPLLAVHGDGDAVVAPRNAVALVRQYLSLNNHPASAADTSSAGWPVPDREERSTLAGGRVETVREWRVEGRLVARHVEVAGLGHAWSGGDAALPFNDAAPPDATALIGAFFADALS